MDEATRKKLGDLAVERAKSCARLFDDGYRPVQLASVPAGGAFMDVDTYGRVSKRTKVVFANPAAWGLMLHGVAVTSDARGQGLEWAFGLRDDGVVTPLPARQTTVWVK